MRLISIPRASVTAVSFVRLYYVVSLDFTDIDVTWMFSEEMMWTGIEVNVGTVCGKSGKHPPENVALIYLLACLPSLKPILNLAIYGAAQHSTPKAYGGSQGLSGIMTIGGSGDPRGRDRAVWLNTPNDDAGSSTSIVLAPSKYQGDAHPFSSLTDNESDLWRDHGSHDLEMDQMARADEGRRERV